MLLDDLDHVIHCETFILWHGQMLYSVRFNNYEYINQFDKMSCLLTFLLATDQIFKEIYGKSIIGWKICLGFNSKKVIYLPLALVFAGKFYSRHLLSGTDI